METIVFTNGCFDLLHPGHIDLLSKAKSLGTKLIVGINSDSSIRKIKGNSRPVVSENARALLLLALKSVDEVRIFEETTPENLIKDIKPDILVKGGDWHVNEIVGGDFVTSLGGKVITIPLVEGFSSSLVISTILSGLTKTDLLAYNPSTSISNSIREHLDMFGSIARNHTKSIKECGELIVSALENGNKILICGNGGSAADAQHIATEITGRFETERSGYPAISLATDTSAITAISNDYGFEKVFSRQVEALAKSGDVLIGISTSGNSPNIIAAIMTARTRGCKTIGLTGDKGKKLAGICDSSVLVPSSRTARIQEAHITIGHIWCEMIDERLK
jgi:D-sedoheptulose 7-phosphate isomerase